MANVQKRHSHACRVNHIRQHDNRIRQIVSYKSAFRHFLLVTFDAHEENKIEVFWPIFVTIRNGAVAFKFNLRGRCINSNTIVLLPPGFASAWQWQSS